MSVFCSSVCLLLFPFFVAVGRKFVTVLVHYRNVGLAAGREPAEAGRNRQGKEGAGGAGGEGGERHVSRVRRTKTRIGFGGKLRGGAGGHTCSGRRSRLHRAGAGASTGDLLLRWSGWRAAAREATRQLTGIGILLIEKRE